MSEGTLPPRSASPLARGPLIVGLCVLAAIVLGAAGLLSFRYFTHNDRLSNIGGGTLTPAPDGLHFRNPAEHLAFTAPAAWARFDTPSAQVMVRGEGCSFGLLEQRTVLTVNALADAEAKDLRGRHPDADPVIAPRTIAGRNGVAFTGTFPENGGSMSETYILVDRGPTVVTLIESATAPECAHAFIAIEDSLSL